MLKFLVFCSDFINFMSVFNINNLIFLRTLGNSGLQLIFFVHELLKMILGGFKFLFPRSLDVFSVDDLKGVLDVMNFTWLSFDFVMNVLLKILGNGSLGNHVSIAVGLVGDGTGLRIKSWGKVAL